MPVLPLVCPLLGLHQPHLLPGLPLQPPLVLPWLSCSPVPPPPGLPLCLLPAPLQEAGHPALNQASIACPWGKDLSAGLCIPSARGSVPSAIFTGGSHHLHTYNGWGEGRFSLTGARVSVMLTAVLCGRHHCRSPGEEPAAPPLFSGQAVTQALPSPAPQPGFLSGTCRPSRAQHYLCPRSRAHDQAAMKQKGPGLAAGSPSSTLDFCSIIWGRFKHQRAFIPPPSNGGSGVCFSGQGHGLVKNTPEHRPAGR